VVAITLVLGLPAAYSLARLDRPWSGPMAIAIFFVYLVPPTLLFLSLSRLVVATGLQDSTWSLVLVYPTITIPVSIWLLMGFLKAIPRDVEEQAMVDGYSRLAAFVRVVLPLAFPGIVAVVVFAFTLTASEFIYALAFVSPTTEKVVSTGVPTELIRGDVFFWQSLQAAAILVAVPIALVFNLFLDRFISGFTRARSRADRPAEQRGDRPDVGLQRHPGVVEAGQGALPGRWVHRPAGVGDHDRDEAEVGAVADRRLDPDLGHRPDDGEGVDPTVAQHQLQGRPHEHRHGELVEHGLAGQRGELGDELEVGRVAQEQRPDVFDPFDPLPGHGGPELEHARQLVGKRQVPGEDHPHPGPPGGLDHLDDPCHERAGVGDVAHDPHLHVVHQQRHPPRVADLLEGLGDLQSMGALHGSSPPVSGRVSGLPACVRWETMNSLASRARLRLLR
jgi:ABC-type spermidine/putrescine transport system permease subunit II